MYFRLTEDLDKETKEKFDNSLATLAASEQIRQAEQEVLNMGRTEGRERKLPAPPSWWKG